MKIFDKQYLDFLSTSPGNYIFKTKSNKSEFGKICSLIYILLSFLILIFYLYSYFLGNEMNVSYYKKVIYGVDHNDEEFDSYSERDECENDNFISYIENKKSYQIKIYTYDGEVNIKDDLYISFSNNIYFEIKDSTIEFETNETFYLTIEKKKDLQLNTLGITFFYKTFQIRNGNKVPLKETKKWDYLNFALYPKFYNEISLHKHYIQYRDGIRLKNFYSYLFFWTHYETTYIDFYYKDYFHIYYENPIETTNNKLQKLAIITNDEFEPTEYYDLYQRKYESFLNILAKWCGIFSSLKIFFSYLVYMYSFSYNNYELVKYVNKIYDNNNYIIYLNKNENNNNEFKNIDKNNLNNNISKEFNKIKTFDIIKYSFCSCLCRKSKINKILQNCDSYMFKYISIENIFYNLLRFETFIENYKIKDNYELQKFEEMKNKINLYEIEIKNIKNKNITKIENLYEKLLFNISLSDNEIKENQ